MATTGALTRTALDGALDDAWSLRVMGKGRRAHRADAAHARDVAGRHAADRAPRDRRGVASGRGREAGQGNLCAVRRPAGDRPPQTRPRTCSARVRTSRATTWRITAWTPSPTSATCPARDGVTVLRVPFENDDAFDRRVDDLLVRSR